MSEMRVQQMGPESTVGVSGIAEERPQSRHDDGGKRQRDDEGRPGGREELAVALGEPGRNLRTELGHDADGELFIRVVDVDRGEVIAMLTPDELRSIAGATGLPSGLLFQARS